MRFCIADSFPKALGRLNAEEQKAVKLSVFDLQINPSNPGLQFHRIENAKDKNFWSMRVSRDIRLIIHKTASSFLVCYVGHHDPAYAWAERRRIETHPRTGAAQIVEVREMVREVEVFKTVERERPAVEQLPLFASRSEDELLSYGVPADWLGDVKKVTEDDLFDLAEHLPQEAAEALLDLAVGATPEVFVAPADNADPFAHPDAQRRFRVMDDLDELKQALDYPWDQWSVFLHPSQRRTVEQTFNGPARVSGSAGTGKSVVAIHRAANILKKNADAKLLLTTFSQPLANSLASKLKILIGEDNPIVPRVTVTPFKQIAHEMFTLAHGYEPRPAKPEQVKSALQAAAEATGCKEFSLRFLVSEWNNVIDAWQVASLEAYKDVPRLGRKNRMSARQREAIWPVVDHVRKALDQQGIYSWPTIFGKVAEHFAQREHKPFTHLVVDEAQDLGVPELKMLATIVPQGPDRMFFAGDLGQRIFQEPFSWKALGINIQGRSRSLKVNYRTSHQIRMSADRLLPKSIRDVDGVEEGRDGTVSVFNGPEPEMKVWDSIEKEQAGLTEWVKQAIDDGVEPAEIGLFVRSNAQLARARQVVKAAGQTPLELSERAEEAGGRIAIGNMHLAKGLEFKAVAVMACDDEILPLQERIETVADDAELDEVYETERHLFYVACTRARDRLLVSGVDPASEFFEDMQQLHPA